MKRALMIRGTLPVFAVLLVLFTAGCGGESYGPSPRVEALWERHPSPWSEESAERAAADAREMLERHPRDYQLARWYLDRLEFADPASVSIEFSSWLEKYPEDPRWVALEALVNAPPRRFLRRLKSAMEKAPRDPYLLTEYARAQMIQAEPDLKGAMEAATKAVQIAPRLPMAQGRLAQLLLANGDARRAEVSARAARQGDPHKYIYAELVARSLYDRGEADQALAELESFHHAHPANPFAVSALLDRYRASGDVQKMIAVKRRAAVSAPGDGLPLVELAMLMNQAGLRDSVFHYLDMAVEKGFFDEEFFHFAFESEIADLREDPRFDRLKRAMGEKRAATREARRREAVAAPLNIPAPSFRAVTLAGDSVRLEDLRGRPVILEFWATWCGWCSVERPFLENFYETRDTLAAPEPHLVSVNLWERVPDPQRPMAVRRYVRNEGIAWPVWLAQDDVGDRYSVQVLPTYAVIDAGGTLRYLLIGYTPFLDEVLTWMIEAVQISRGGQPDRQPLTSPASVALRTPACTLCPASLCHRPHVRVEAPASPLAFRLSPCDRPV